MDVFLLQRIDEPSVGIAAGDNIGSGMLLYNVLWLQRIDESSVGTAAGNDIGFGVLSMDVL